MSTTSQTVALTDSAGNAYTDAVAQGQSIDGHQIHVFYAKNIKGGVNTVIARFSSTNPHPWLAIFEYSGLSLASPLDQTAHAQGTSSSASSGATGTTKNPNELVFAAVGAPATAYSGSFAAGSGYTILLENTNTSKAADEALIAGATGSFNGKFGLNSSTNWSSVIATFTP